MILLLVQSLLSHKHGEVDILHAYLLEERIAVPLNLLPDVVRGGAQDVATGDVIVFDQVRLGDYLRVPLAKVLFLCKLNASLVSIWSCLGLCASLVFLLSSSSTSCCSSAALAGGSSTALAGGSGGRRQCCEV